MGQMIELTAADGHSFGAYRADPVGTPKGGLVVIQEIFGVNSHMRSVADRFAGEGYSVISPALFDRAERGAELGYTQEDVQRGLKLREDAGGEGPLADVQASINALKGAGKVGVIGYCWGGTLSFLAATRLSGLDCAVGYYGGGIAEAANEMTRVPVILHFGETDHTIPMSDVETIREHHPDMTIYTYPAGHGFNCDQRGSYAADSAKLALDRTLAFFKAKLG